MNMNPSKRVTLRVGNRVIIKNHSRGFNGRQGYIVGIDGDYHYVDIVNKGDNINIECYGCELTKIGHSLPEELFEI
jgi:signal peptidase I